MKGYFEKMKKFVLAFGIPVLAVASLIGSGYATWYFNSGIVTGEKGITLDLKEKKVVGAIFQHTEESISLVLDQPQPVEPDGMPNNDRTGLHFEGGFIESLKAYEGDDNPSDDKFVDGTFYKVTTKITIPSEVAEYVNFTFNDQNSSTDGLTLTKVVDKLEVKSSTQAYEVFNISEVNAEYTANKPTTSDQYDTMRNALFDKANSKFKSISISFEAEIVTTTTK